MVRNGPLFHSRLGVVPLTEADVVQHGQDDGQGHDRRRREMGDLVDRNDACANLPAAVWRHRTHALVDSRYGSATAIPTSQTAMGQGFWRRLRLNLSIAPHPFSC